MQLTEQEGFELESMLDATSLETVLEALAVICTEKGSHLRSAWQDAPSARHWEAAANKLMELAATQTIQNVCRP